MSAIYKKVRSLFLIILSLFLVSCSEEQLPAGALLSLIRQRLQLQTTSVSFGFNSDLTQTITIEGENTPWTLTGLPSWLSASPTSGNGAATITLTAKENTSVDESNVALLTFSSTAADYQYSKTIDVSQPSAQIYITPSESSLSYRATGETKSLNISSNVDWTAKSSDSWLTVEKVNNTQLHITAKENLNNKTNTATVFLLRSGTTNTITSISVTQAEAGVTGSTEDIAFAVDGEVKATTINAEASWTAYASDQSWISVTPSQGDAGSATLTITTTANNSVKARNGFVYVRIGTTDKLAIPISQEGVNYSLSTNSLTLKSTTEDSSFTIEANATWSVISKPDWLEVKPANGSKGKTTITITPQDNPNTTSRSGSIVIGRDGFSGNKTISVKQEGKTFPDLEEQLDFSYSASSQSLTITTDGQWTAYTDDSWIHLSPTSGMGTGTLTVSVDVNTEKDSRIGTVSISVGATTQQIKVVQIGSYFNISYDDLLTNSKPATIKLTVTSNMDWTASSNVDWLTIEPKQGTGDATITLSVKDNASINARTGIVSIVTSFETKNLSFTQPGRTLSLSVSELIFTVDGGSSEAITVTTDGSFTVTPSASWLSVNQDGNNFTVTATQNSTNVTRSGSVIVALTGLDNGEEMKQSIKIIQGANDPLGLCPDTNHPHQIDMGTGVIFACCNVGASSPTGYGDYFAWGETTTKSSYYWTTYKLCNGTNSSLTKYCNSSSNGTVDNIFQLENTDDAATVNWNNAWRMPTIDELSDLNTKCTWTWTTINDVAGFKVTGTNGNVLFLPAAGFRIETGVNDVSSIGYYWSSSLYSSNASNAHCLYFNSSSHSTTYYKRNCGLSVRPVYGPSSPPDDSDGAKSFTVTGNGKKITFKMIKVESGTFTMGATSEQSNEANDTERPAHQVTLTKDYYLGETEVTQALWYAVMGQSPTSNGNKWNTTYGLGDDYPAYYISYTDCQNFLNKLNEMTGEAFRFPTEAEWEFAARGGNASKGYKYAGSNTIDDVAWYKDNSESATHPVAQGQKKANELGLYDMSGNVWEWCYDWFGIYPSTTQTNPTGISSGYERVYRGGGFSSIASYCRTANRAYYQSSFTANILGFRLAF